MKQKLIPGNNRHGEDDLILEVVVFIGTCAKDTFAAQYICKSNTLECLIDLLKAKQEDDEIVLQVRSLNFFKHHSSKYTNLTAELWLRALISVFG